MAVRLLVFACVAVLAASGAIAAPEQVDIPDGELTLHATLYRPEGSGPFPAVVALHDCGGLSRPNTEAQLYAEWAKTLVASGFVVVFPDSFGSRGLGSQCRERHRTVRASRERVADANAARHWLQQQSYVRGDRISLLGWSNGAVTALWTVRLTAAAAHPDAADFRSAVAFYPSCGRLLQAAWSARLPTLVLIGSADDWTLATSCQQMVAGARGRSARVQIVVYPGAHHEFDRANSPVRLRTGLVNTADPSGRAHGGTNPTARSDALRRVPQWLGR